MFRYLLYFVLTLKTHEFCLESRGFILSGAPHSETTARLETFECFTCRALAGRLRGTGSRHQLSRLFGQTWRILPKRSHPLKCAGPYF